MALLPLLEAVILGFRNARPSQCCSRRTPGGPSFQKFLASCRFDLCKRAAPHHTKPCNSRFTFNFFSLFANMLVETFRVPSQTPRYLWSSVLHKVEEGRSASAEVSRDAKSCDERWAPLPYHRDLFQPRTSRSFMVPREMETQQAFFASGACLCSTRRG